MRIEYPCLPSEYAEAPSVKRFVILARNFGPAAIVASVAIGAGESVLAVRLGAWAEYSLMWVVPLSALIKGGLLTYLLGRYTVLTGELISERMAKVPGPKYWSVIFVLVISISMAPFFVSAVAGACGGLLQHLLEVGNPIHWSILVAIVTTALGTLGSFQYLERLQVMICALLVAGMGAGVIMANPSLVDMLVGIVSFGSVPDFPAWAARDPAFVERSRLLELATAFGYVGGSMATYAVYANWTTIHGWGLSKSPDIERIRDVARNSGKPDYLPSDPEQIQLGQRHLLRVKYDVFIGMFVLLFVSWAFMIAGAAIMYPNELLPSGYVLLAKQKIIWAQVSPFLVPLYYFSILLVLCGTLYANPEMYTRLTHEFGTILWRRIGALSYRKFSLCVGVYLLIGSVLLLMTGIRPVRMMDIAALLSTNIGITVLLSISLWMNLLLPKPYRPGRMTVLGGAIGILILGASAFLSIIYI
jgi:hypothetical protein